MRRIRIGKDACQTNRASYPCWPSVARLVVSEQAADMQYCTSPLQSDTKPKLQNMGDLEDLHEENSCGYEGLSFPSTASS